MIKFSAFSLVGCILCSGQALALAGADSADIALSAFKSDKPGLAALVVEHGEVVYERYLGEADIEHHQPVTTMTRFHVASVSKQFTAFAILQLAALRKIDLDADVHVYLPDLPHFSSTLTVSDLVHHTSGLRDQWDMLVLAGASRHGLLTQSAILRLIKNQRELNFTPGTYLVYCNTGYTLLAEIVARVSGIPFREYIKNEVFQPLGMNDSLIYDDASDLLPDRAMSYSISAGESVKLSRLNYSAYGPTSMHTTVRDLAKWSKELLHPKVFSPDLVLQARTMGQLHDGEPINYGFGMYRDIFSGHHAISHSGSDAGYKSMVASFPSEDATIVVLSNGQADVRMITNELAKDFFGLSSSAINPTRPDRALLAKLSGFYANNWGAGFVLRVKDGHLLAVGDGQRRVVSFFSDGTFHLGSGTQPWRRLSDGSLEEQTLLGVKLIHHKVELAQPSPAELLSIAGSYHSDELDVTYHLVPTARGIQLESLRSDPILLLPVDKDSFENDDLRITISRDGAGKVLGLTVATGRTRGLSFARQQA